jgi:hypothetical protein
LKYPTFVLAYSVEATTVLSSPPAPVPLPPPFPVIVLHDAVGAGVKQVPTAGGEVSFNITNPFLGQAIIYIIYI